MTEILRPDLCVLGGGAAGLAAAWTAAGEGASVVLVEKRALGGNELAQALPAQVFCAAAAEAAAVNRAAKLGLANSEPHVDLGRLRAHMQEVVKRFGLDDSPARLQAMNIKLIRAAGFFTGSTRLEAGGLAIDAKRFIIATGATPSLPLIAGLELVRPLTPEALPLLDDLPKELIVIGSGFHELALAQAFLRLGARVVLLEPDTILPTEDEELVAPVLTRLAREGLVIHQQIEILRIEPTKTGVRVTLGKDAPAVEGSHLMVATTPLPCVEGFGLKAAHVSCGKEGIKVDADGRTSNRQIHAVGDVLGGPDSAMAARHQGERVAAMLFAARQGAPPLVARVLCTDPEMAVIGLSEAAARAKYKSISVLRAPFCDNQRALIAFAPQGHVKIVTDSQGIILGAGIVGPHARELIGTFGLAIGQQMKAADLETIVWTASTLTQACRSAALASGPQVGKARQWRRLRPLGPPR
jgi:pyruvate/2-oxoglutarate dehydrogenase complex dihydrolipoamide dehydrogenase (E3) component